MVSVTEKPLNPYQIRARPQVWVVACICLHAWLMKHEAEECEMANSDGDKFQDPFITHGLSDASDSDAQPVASTALLARGASNRLGAEKAVREKLKVCLLQDKEKRFRSCIQC